MVVRHSHENSRFSFTVFRVAGRTWAMKRVLPLLAIVCFSLGPAWSAQPAASATNRPVIIFDTDMGSDVDDAGALALLHRLADLGEVELVGVIFSSGKMGKMYSELKINSFVPPITSPLTGSLGPASPKPSPLTV